MEIWYFETSAVNELMQNMSLEDALATKHLQLNKGRDWRLSPVTLWEILMTSDEERRDEIVHFCQHLFSHELLPSPSELIIPFIEQGMPKEEKRRKLVSHTSIAQTWKELVDDRNRCFITDHAEMMNRVKMIQTLTKNIHNIIKKKDLIIESYDMKGAFEFSLNNLLNQIPFIKNGEPVNDEEKLVYKVSIYYILLLLCSEVELENSAIKEFWAKKGIDCTQARILHILENYPELVHRGPFIMMAYMTISQASGKYPRGVWFDSMHSVYLTYADKIFTTDGHFQGLREIIPEPILQQKLHHMDEVEFTRHNINQFGVTAT